MFGLGTTELVIVLVIVLVLFGGKKLRSLGSDLGGAISEFKTSLNTDDDEEESKESNQAAKSADSAEKKSEDKVEV